MMPTRSLVLGAVLGLAVFAWACDSHTALPAGPSGTPIPSSSAAALPSAAEQASSGTHGELLTAIRGEGSGNVNVTPTASVVGSFSAQINVNVHDAPPNTRFYIQRAPEIGRANGADGICQRAAGLPSWGPPTPNFVTFALPGNPTVTLVTSDGGSGTAHLDFTAPAILDGTRFDVMFRLVDDLSTPANEMRTGCFTVTVK
jgi:hypothetical protein